MNFINKDTNVENVLLVDGVTRAGKFFLAEILSGFDKVEFFQYLPLLEQIPVIYGMGKIMTNISCYQIFRKKAIKFSEEKEEFRR